MTRSTSQPTYAIADSRIGRPQSPSAYSALQNAERGSVDGAPAKQSESDWLPSPRTFTANLRVRSMIGWIERSLPMATRTSGGGGGTAGNAVNRVGPALAGT